jgi:predicted  nucleic acid-binding Zn-ribbon protein
MTTAVIIGLILSLLTNIALAVKYFIDRKDRKQERQEDKRTQAQIDAFEQLSQVLTAIKTEAEAKRIYAKECEDKIDELEECLGEMEEKIHLARLDILELLPNLRTCKRLLKELDIDDLGVFAILDELESKLTEIGANLKKKILGETKADPPSPAIKS